jgi:hypothetical protein
MDAQSVGTEDTSLWLLEEEHSSPAMSPCRTKDSLTTKALAVTSSSQLEEVDENDQHPDEHETEVSSSFGFLFRSNLRVDLDCNV